CRPLSARRVGPFAAGLLQPHVRGLQDGPRTVAAAGSARRTVVLDRRGRQRRAGGALRSLSSARVVPGARRRFLWASERVAGAMGPAPADRAGARQLSGRTAMRGTSPV